ncbi:hypothetical protein T492DRAFT_1070487 [Pavlovales sp. CCMP2436]|nr:hypothetical protein T492DRAFT_1070487 [Pavlovales sp. CCMP2436]
MIRDKRHKRSTFDKQDLLLAPESIPALPWECPPEGFLGPTQPWRESWMAARGAGGPAEGFLFRSFKYENKSTGHRFLKAQGWSEGTWGPDTVREKALGAHWHGPRHLLPEIAEFINVNEQRRDLLGRWDNASSAARHKCESRARLEARTALARPSNRTAMPAHYSARATDPVHFALRNALIRVVRQANAGSDWKTLWTRGPDLEQTRIVLTDPRLTELANAARKI